MSTKTTRRVVVNDGGDEDGDDGSSSSSSDEDLPYSSSSSNDDGDDEEEDDAPKRRAIVPPRRPPLPPPKSIAPPKRGGPPPKKARKVTLVDALRVFVPAPQLRMPNCPEFDGEGDVDHYIANAKVYLNQFPADSETQKVRLIGTGLTGKARDVLLAHRGSDTLNTVDKLFKALKFVCGQKLKPIEKLDRLKQEAGETCALFGCKVKRLALKAMPKCQDERRFDKFCLGFFKAGARASVAKRLKALNPKTFKEAVKMCRDIDDDRVAFNVNDELAAVTGSDGGGPRTSRTTPADDTVPMSQFMQLMLQLQQQQASAQQQAATAQAAALEQIARIVGGQGNPPAGAQQPRYQPRGGNQSQQGPQGQQGQQGRGQPRRGRMTCFHCNELGHSYRNCPTATNADVTRIQQQHTQDGGARRGQARNGGNPPRA